MNWMQVAVDSLKEKLIFAFELKESKEAAIAYVKNQSTAGAAAWEEALNQLGWSK